MSNKNTKKHAPNSPVSRKVRARLEAQQKPKLSGIQIGGIVVIVLVVLALAWAMIANLPKPTASTPTPTMAEVPAEVPVIENHAKQYAAAPAMQIDPAKSYTATVKMAKGGEFVIELYPDKAPLTVNNFVFLAREGFFNGITFHRVISTFMAQTGDPTGTGMGGPGYAFEDEFSDLTFDKEGVVAMANSGPDTNGSQFFVTYKATDWLNGKHTIFGQVISGMDVVKAITQRDPEQNPSFTGDVIESITITEK